MELDESDLFSRLQLHNDYFKRMTDLIPPKYYFEQETQQGQGTSGGKFIHNAKGNAPKQQLKEKSQKKKGTSAKRQRLDPTQQKSVTEIQAGFDSGDLLPGGVASGSRIWREKSEDESESDAMGTGLEDLTDEQTTDEEKETSKPKPPRIKPMSVESVTSTASIDELREKVRKRIEELRTKRKAKAPLPDVVPKKIARKEAEKEKKKKIEAMKAIKQSKAQLEVLENAAKNKMVNGGKAHDSSSSSDSEDMTDRTSMKDKKKKKKIKNKEGSKDGPSFSQFDFAESEREQPKKKKRKKLTEPRGSRDYGRLLKKAELRQQKLKEIKEKDPDKALEVETEDKWQKVMDRAQGVKVKDDIELIKKSMKRKEQRKKASKKRWEERETKLKDKMKQKDEKRKKNIQSKTEARKSKKVKRLQHKGKLLLQD